MDDSPDPQQPDCLSVAMLCLHIEGDRHTATNYGLVSLSEASEGALTDAYFAVSSPSPERAD